MSTASEHHLSDRALDLIRRCMLIACPTCGVAPGVSCSESAARDTPGNQFHYERIKAAKSPTL